MVGFLDDLSQMVWVGLGRVGGWRGGENGGERREVGGLGEWNMSLVSWFSYDAPSLFPYLFSLFYTNFESDFLMVNQFGRN